MIRIAICEDELKQRIYIKSIIENESNKRNLTIKINNYESGEHLIKYLEESINEFDIIFLDIKMKKISGIDTAKIIRSNNKKVLIIFITGLSEYVFEGYNVRAFNYLIKPINEKKIIRVFNEALDTLEKAPKAEFILTVNNEIFKIKYENIEYFASDKRKIDMICIDNSYNFYGSLNDIEKTLDANNFVRCHRRYIVNLENVKHIKEKTITTINGNKLPVSRNRYKDTVFAFAKNIIR
ncbi:MAG: LytTR family DNA-binding domain-containing protein [Clostridiales bacterium]